MSPLGLGYDPNVDTWTLAEVADRGTLAFECKGCGHLAMILSTDLAGFKDKERVATVRRRMRCRRCGACYPGSLVRLKIGRGPLGWWPMPPSVGR